MQKGTIVLAALLAVAMTTTADAAKKKAAPADPAIEASQQSALFITDAFQPWGPQRTMAPAKGKKK